MCAQNCTTAKSAANGHSTTGLQKDSAGIKICAEAMLYVKDDYCMGKTKNDVGFFTESTL